METPNLFWEGNGIGLKHRLENKSKLLLLLQLIKKRKRCKIYNWSNCCTKGPPKALPKQDWLWKLLWVWERSHKKKYKTWKLERKIDTSTYKRKHQGLTRFCLKYTSIGNCGGGFVPSPQAFCPLWGWRTHTALFFASDVSSFLDLLPHRRKMHPTHAL